MPKEESDAIREYKAAHEENFLRSWLREDGREKEERTVEMSNKNEEERGEKRTRNEEENNTGIEILSQRRDLESCGDLSWEDL